MIENRDDFLLIAKLAVDRETPERGRDQKVL